MLATVLSRLAVRLDRSLIFHDLGMTPDTWQETLLRSNRRRLLVNVHRQGGKSDATAALGITTALEEAGSLILVVSRSGRQADELFRKLTGHYRTLGEPVSAVEDRADTLALMNESRIVSLPNNPEALRGFSSPRLIIVDESARVPDAMFTALTPMLLVGGGRMVELSTPYGKRGHFYEAWTKGGADYERILFRASQNPRLDSAFLAEERRTMLPRQYAQEYECSFEEVVGAVFDADTIEAAFNSARRPLGLGSTL